MTEKESRDRRQQEFFQYCIEQSLEEFEYSHLPEHLQQVSKPFAKMAVDIYGATAYASLQKMRALDFLLLAKDAAVRDMKNQHKAGK